MPYCRLFGFFLLIFLISFEGLALSEPPLRNKSNQNQHLASAASPSDICVVHQQKIRELRQFTSELERHSTKANFKALLRKVTHTNHSVMSKEIECSASPAAMARTAALNANPNILQNSGFENGASAWVHATDNGRSIITNPSLAHSGSAFLRIFSTNNKPRLVYQNIPLGILDQVYAAMFAKPSSLPVAIVVKWYDRIVTSENLSNQRLIRLDTLSDLGGTTYHSFEGRLQAPPNAVMARLQVIVAAAPSNGVGVYVDDSQFGQLFNGSRSSQISSSSLPSSASTSSSSSHSSLSSTISSSTPSSLSSSSQNSSSSSAPAINIIFTPSSVDMTVTQGSIGNIVDVTARNGTAPAAPAWVWRISQPCASGAGILEVEPNGDFGQLAIVRNYSSTTPGVYNCAVQVTDNGITSHTVTLPVRITVLAASSSSSSSSSSSIRSSSSASSLISSSRSSSAISSSSSSSSAGAGIQVYVDVAGSSKPGYDPFQPLGSINHPFATIQDGINSGAGQTINVRGGTYYERPRIWYRGGSANARLTLRAMPGEHVIIDGGMQNHDVNDHLETLSLVNSPYWVIEGLEIRGCYDSGIELYVHDDFTVLRENYVHDCGGSAIYVRGSNDVTIEYNEVSKSYNGIYVREQQVGTDPSGAPIYKWSDRPEIRYNLAHNNDDTVRDIAHGGNSDGICVAGPYNGIIEYNLAWENRDDGIDNSVGQSSSYTHPSLYTIMRFNAAWRSGKAGTSPGSCMPNGTGCIMPEGNGAGVKANTNAGGDNTIHHNIAFDCGTNGFDNDQEQNWGPDRFYNNTAYGNGGNGLALDMPGVSDQASGAYVLNNLLYNNLLRFGNYDLEANGSHAINQCDYNFTGNGMSCGSFGRIGNPLLVAPNSPIDVTGYQGSDIPGKWLYVWQQVQHNFALQLPSSGNPGSQARDAGVLIPGINDNYIGAAPDMGAVEQ